MNEGIERKSSVWESFDAMAAKVLVEKSITFQEFVEKCSADFGRMAAIAARRRRLPAWMGIDDVKNEAIRLAWHYGFERKDRRGNVGFHPGMYRNAGAYLRFKIRNKLAKIISSARGENQHTRKGPPSPEFLSKTGEVPEEIAEPTAERELSDARGKAALDRFCRAVREMVLAREIDLIVGSDAKLAAFFLERPMRADREFGRAMRELGIFTDDDARRAVAALRVANVLPKVRRNARNEQRDRCVQAGEGLGIQA